MLIIYKIKNIFLLGDIIKEILFYFLFVSLLGSILHFTYNLFKKNIIVAIFSAVNESTWEHIKIMLSAIFVINTLFYVNGNIKNIFITMSIELLLAIFLISGLYKIKVAIFKDKYDLLNISIFYIAALIISFVRYFLIRVDIPVMINKLFIIPCIIIYIMYLSFTVFPPKKKLFLDPVTNTYGINNIK